MGRSATIATDAMFAAEPGAVWRAVAFYEEIDHAPPLLLRIALPRPLRSEGPKDRVGGLVRCTYMRGHLVKRMTEVEEERLLAFDVVEQELRFGAGVRLLGGRVELRPEAGGTRLTMATRFVSRPLRPRAVWEPVEGWLVHAFHRHVLEGTRRRLARAPASAPATAPLATRR